MSDIKDRYRWHPLIKQSQSDLNCSNEEELRQKLLEPANKEKLLNLIKSRQLSAPGKIDVKFVDGFDGPARTTMSKLYPQLTVSQQFSTANREIRFGDLPCLLVRINDSDKAQQLPIEMLMTRVDTAQRRYDPLPWMLNPPATVPEPTPSPPAPAPNRAEEIINEIHVMQAAITRLADAAEVECAFIRSDRQHLQDRIEKLTEDLKAKEAALNETKQEVNQLRSAFKVDKPNDSGYPTLDKKSVDTAARKAANRTPSESEFFDILSIVDDDSKGNSTKGTKRRAPKAESSTPPKKAATSSAPSVA